MDATTGNLSACLDLLMAVQQAHPAADLAASQQRTRELLTLAGAAAAVHADAGDPAQAHRCASKPHSPAGHIQPARWETW